MKKTYINPTMRVRAMKVRRLLLISIQKGENYTSGAVDSRGDSSDDNDWE